MRNAYDAPRITLLTHLTADVIAASSDYPDYENGNMGEWDDAN